MYIIGLWYYRVRVEETRKELSYLSAMGAVTDEGNFNNCVCWQYKCSLYILLSHSNSNWLADTNES